MPVNVVQCSCHRVQILTKICRFQQLKNILEKKVNPSKEEYKRKETDRNFDFSKFQKRHILLKFCYLGWDYEGYVIQENTTETIEFYLFQALSKVCLIGKFF